MALIKCNECDKEISDSAATCPQCGAPQNITKRSNFVWTKKYNVFAGTFIVIFTIWLYFTPYIAINNLKNAAESKDFDTVESYIDIPSCRESIKSYLSAKMSEDMASEQNNPFAALGMAMIAPMVDAMITPENISRLMIGKEPIIDKSDKESSSSEISKEINVLEGYEGFNKFYVSVTRTGENKVVKFIFNRENLFTWKLTSINIIEEDKKSSNPVSETPNETVTEPAPVAKQETEPINNHQTTAHAKYDSMECHSAWTILNNSCKNLERENCENPVADASMPMYANGYLEDVAFASECAETCYGKVNFDSYEDFEKRFCNQ